jgi:hypothetical protein
MTDTITITKSEYDALKKDAERLDWIDAMESRRLLVFSFCFKLNCKIREAIDTAIGEKK